jgi:lysyl-tRNA synthetase class 2
VEVYQAYADYNDMMTLTEQLIASVCEQVCGTTQITYQGRGGGPDAVLEAGHDA